MEEEDRAQAKGTSKGKEKGGSGELQYDDEEGPSNPETLLPSNPLLPAAPMVTRRREPIIDALPVTKLPFSIMPQHLDAPKTASVPPSASPFLNIPTISGNRLFPLVRQAAPQQPHHHHHHHHCKQYCCLPLCQFPRPKQQCHTY